MLQAISPFATVFSKDLYCRHVKTRACLGKGLTVQRENFFGKKCEKRISQHFLPFPIIFFFSQPNGYKRKISLFGPFGICTQMLSNRISPNLCLLIRILTVSQTRPGFYKSAVEVFENTVGKRRNCS